MNKVLRYPLHLLGKFLTVRPLTFFTIGGILTAFDPHYPTTVSKVWHVVVCIAGGVFIELLAIGMARQINRERRKILEQASKDKLPPQ